jgi:hypothetical protein
VSVDKALGLLLLALAALALAGCAATGGAAVPPPAAAAAVPQAAAAPAHEAIPAPLGWWHARFRMGPLERGEPAWEVDSLLANEVVAPVFGRHRGAIGLWRVHRRAARDGAGHQFSFIFQASPETAGRVYAALGESSVLAALRAARVVRETVYDPTDRVERPNVEDTSDRSWSPEVQRAWPAFIQGVSETWMSLVREEAGRVFGARAPIDPPRVERLLAGYREVERAVGERWRDEGGHAFLHHLSAVFGYRPVEVVERRTVSY